MQTKVQWRVRELRNERPPVLITVKLRSDHHVKRGRHAKLVEANLPPVYVCYIWANLLVY